MSEQIFTHVRSFTATINSHVLRFIALGTLDQGVRVVLGDVIVVAGYPQANRQEMLKDVSAVELRTIALQGRETPLVKLGTARELMMRAAELGHCPAYQTDVFEVIASYARDQLLARSPSVRIGTVDALCGETGE